MTAGRLLNSLHRFEKLDIQDCNQKSLLVLFNDTASLILSQANSVYRTFALSGGFG